MKNEILRLENVTLFTNNIKRLDHINLSVLEGEVVGLLGEHGSGKNIVMDIISGAQKPDSGNVFFKENRINAKKQLQIIRDGIGYVEQGINIIPELSVAENIMLGSPELPSWSLDKLWLNEKAQGMLDLLDIHDIDMDIIAKELTFLQSKLVEIMRMLTRNISILVLNTPILLSNDKETNLIESVIKKLKKMNISVLFTSTKIKETMEIADKIIVLRKGMSVGAYDKSLFNEEQLLYSMIGEEGMRKAMQPVNNDRALNGRELLKIKNISSQIGLNHIDFTLFENEILGIVGQEGCGMEMLSDILYGINQDYTGEIFLRGERVKIRTPQDALKLKIAMIPKNLRQEAIIDKFTAGMNITLPSMQRICVFGTVRQRMEKQFVSRYCGQVGLDASQVNKRMRLLSMESYYRVAMAKILAVRPKIVILNDPTANAGIVMKKEIFEWIGQLSKEAGVLIFAQEIEDIMELFDRMLVMRKGTIVGEFLKSEFNKKIFMQYSN